MYVFPIIANFFSQMNGIVKYEALKITNLNDYSNYVFDRYLLHGPHKGRFVYRGVDLDQNDGYMEYLVKKDKDFPEMSDLSDFSDQELGLSEREISPLDLSCPFAPDLISRGVKRKSDASLRQIKRQEKSMKKFITVQPSPGIKEKIDVLTLKSNPTTSVRAVSTRTKKTIEVDLTKLNARGKKLRLKLKRRVRSVSEDEIPLIIEDIRQIIPRPGYDDGSLAPVLVRLAWHCCATYDQTTKTGGSNGATMRFVPEITDEGNFGLDVARSALEPIKQAYSISYSDLWTLAGKVAIEYMNGPIIEWQKGRIDHKSDNYVPPNGRLPFGDKNANHIRATFSRMGFNDQEAVVLLGCHAIGRCHKRISGWEGKWTANPLNFSNEFFKSLLQEEWTLGTVPETGKSQYYNQNKELMMLITDYQLLNDESFLYWVKVYADDEPRYFRDFSTTFSKLLELGIERENGRITNHVK